MLASARHRSLGLLFSAFCVTVVQPGTDGATPLFFHEQMVDGNLEQLAGGLPIGLDMAGKLVPATLKVGSLVNRSQPASDHYREVHRWLVNLSFGVTVLVVFDSFGRYPPKARTHSKRTADAEKYRDTADTLDDAGNGAEPAADTWWNRVLHCGALRDLVPFTMQLCGRLGIRYVFAPYEADHQLAYLAKHGVVRSVHPPHDDGDIPVYGNESVLFRMRHNGDFSHLRVFDSVLGQRVKPKPTKAGEEPGDVDLTAVTTVESFATDIILGGCDYFKQKGVAAPTAHKRYLAAGCSLDVYARTNLGVDLQTAAGRASSTGRELLAARSTFLYPLAFEVRPRDPHLHPDPSVLSSLTSFLLSCPGHMGRWEDHVGVAF